MTILNRKCNTSFHITWKSSTLDDLEGRHWQPVDLRSATLATIKLSACLLCWITLAKAESRARWRERKKTGVNGRLTVCGHWIPFSYKTKNVNRSTNVSLKNEQCLNTLSTASWRRLGDSGSDRQQLPLLPTGIIISLLYYIFFWSSDFWIGLIIDVGPQLWQNVGHMWLYL